MGVIEIMSSAVVLYMAYFLYIELRSDYHDNRLFSKIKDPSFPGKMQKKEVQKNISCRTPRRLPAELNY